MRLVFLLASLCILSRVSADDTWDRVVLASEGDSLAPKATQKVLQELDAAYASKNDPTSLGIKFQVKALLEASRIRESKCNKDSLEQLDSLISTFSPYKLNVIPFLEHYKSKQIKLCKLAQGDDESDEEDSAQQEPLKYPVEQAKPLSFEEEYRSNELRNLDQARSLGAKIFSPEAAKMSPSETVAILDQMSEIAVNGYHYPEEWKMLEDAWDLKYVSRDPVICLSYYLEEMEKKLKRYSQLKNTVVPLLEESRRKLLNFCKAEAESEFQADLARIPEESKNKINFLMTGAREGDLTTAVKSYLKKWEPKVAKIKGLQKFRDEVRALLLNQKSLCSYTTYMGLSTYANMVATVDLGPEFQRWMDNKRICKELNDRGEEIISNVYCLLKQDKKHCFGW